MSTLTERGRHRTAPAPWPVRLACWWHGHQVQPLGNGYVLCARCDRVTRQEHP